MGMFSHIAKIFLPPPPAHLRDHSNNTVIEPLRQRLQEQTERMTQRADEMRACARRITDLAYKSDSVAPNHNGHKVNGKP